MSNSSLKITLAVVTIIAIALAATLIYKVVQDSKGTSSQTTSKPTTGTTGTKTEPTTPTRATTRATSVEPNYCPSLTEPFPYEHIRLPVTLRPSLYHIYMEVDLEDKMSFEGWVEVTFNSTKPTNFVVLHAKKLNLLEYTIKDMQNNELKIKKVLYCQSSEQLYIEVDGSMEADRDYTLKIEFNAPLSTALAGLYKSSYVNAAGKTKWIASTQFEAIDARSVFPCFDEPNMKASFRMQILHHKDLTALFNTEKETTIPRGPDHVLDTFALSPYMSTYLVAMVISDFKYKSASTKRHTFIRVFAPDNQISQVEYAVTVAVKVLEFYEDFFGIPYPLNKLDLVAVPDFPIGAMENWGLITYRLTAILYDPAVSSAYNKQRVTTVIAHEIAHQWFGNLVTMDWWNDLWLNEGFASFMEYIGTDHVNKNFKAIDQFIPMDLSSALSADSLKSSHPISVKIEDPNEINSLFDSISYNKGSSLVRMMQSFVGFKALKAGLKSYLNKYNHANAITNDLWNSLSEEVTGMNITAIMKTWTEQMNYPLVTLEKSADGNVVATQERYLRSTSGHPSKYVSPYGYKWYVPLTCITDVDKKAYENIHWMKMSSVEFSVSKNSKWIKANHEMKGFYRVQYTEENWKALTDQLLEDHLALSEADRANLLEDSFSLASSGKLKMSIALDMSKYLFEDLAYVPWTVALDQLFYIDSQLASTSDYFLYKEYILKLASKNIESLKWEDGGSHIDKFRRTMIFDLAVRLGHEQSIINAKEMFDKMAKDNSLVIPDLKNPVYRAAMQYGGNEEFEVLWKALKETDVPSEERLIMRALGTASDSKLIKKYLTLAMKKDSIIRKGDIKHVLSYVSDNPVGRIVLWEFVQEKWQDLVDFYGNGYGMPRVILASGKHFSTQEKYDEVKKFYENHKIASGKNAVLETLEQIHINIVWKEKYLKQVTDWLKLQ